MRHLHAEELLLYAEGELEDGELCQHVVDCVDCKARLVDEQESYVLVARHVRSQLSGGPPGHDQLVILRSRMAAEAQVRAMHLSTEELLLSLERRIGDDRERHLATCDSCRNRASKLHAELSAIEFALRRQAAAEIPEEWRAIALERLRDRMGADLDSSRPAWRARIFRFPVPPVRPMMAYGAAVAAACMLAWLGWNAAAPPITPEPAVRARAVAPDPGPGSQLLAIVAEPAEPPRAGQTRPRRFTPARRAPSRPSPVGAFQPIPAPVPVSRTPPATQLAVALPSLSDLPVPPSAPPTAAPARVVAVAAAGPRKPEIQDPGLLAEGSLMLVRSGPWKSNLRASGSDSIVRFSGNLASDAERVVAERALLAVAGDRPVEFEIGVGTPAASVGAPSVSAVAWRHGTLGGPVRNALLQHYEDAARRSFQEPAQGLLESELDRFVSGVLRHDAELLSHVHALHGLLTRSRLAAGERPAESFRKVAEFHLDGIGQHRAGVAGQLSESLPRRFWSYRGKRRPEVTPEDARGMAELLLRDALALDQALAALFFGSGATVEFRASNLSTADLLARIRHSARQLRSALR